MTGPPVATDVGPRRLRAVFETTFFVRFGFGLTVSIFASYLIGRSAGIDAGAVGLVGVVSALAPIGEFSTVLLSGAAADRWGRLPVLFAGTALAATLLALVSLTRSPVVLGVLNLLFGVASGAILAASLAVVGDDAVRGRRGYEMGRFDAVNLLGWILGFALGFGALGVLSNADLVWPFRAGAAALALGLGVAYLLTRGRTEPERVAGTEPLGRALSAALRRDVLVVTLPWFVIYMLIGTVFVFLGTAATGAGLPATDLAALIGGGGLILLLTQPSFGRLADRYGRLRLMLVGTVGFVGLLITAGLLAAYGPLPVLVGAASVSALAALAYGPAALAALTDLTHRLSRATTMAVYSLTISLGMLVGLLASTELFSRFGAAGLDVFFAGVATGLIALTLVRYHDVRSGRVAEEAVPSPTTPAR